MKGMLNMPLFKRKAVGKSEENLEHEKLKE